MTRDDVSKVLAVGLRTVGRLARDGHLTKVVVSAKAVRITRASLDAHVMSRSVPRLPPHNEVFSKVTQTTTTYVLLVSPAPDVGEASERALGAGFPGCVVAVSDNVIRVTWPASLGYDPETIGRVVQRVGEATPEDAPEAPQSVTP